MVAPSVSARLLCGPVVFLLVSWSLALPAQAQSESFLLGPGSTVGPATEVKPKNCVTAPDGSVTCDTELVNPAGDTRAKPQLEMFKN
jgi:hypothetical protein